jgi:hypothetical protein
MVARKNAGKELELGGGGDLDQKEKGEEEGKTASETPDPSRFVSVPVFMNRIRIQNWPP